MKGIWNMPCFSAWAVCGVSLVTNNTAVSIPWSEIGAKAGEDYRVDGVGVTPSASGAQLHCMFQRLDGEVTADGLWLTSSLSNSARDHFRVVAVEVGRKRLDPEPQSELHLAEEGRVSMDRQTVRMSRPGLTEEYSVSLDGVRQDFIVEGVLPAAWAGELVVKLAVTGAQIEAAPYGARLVLEYSGRRLDYSRLRVTDAAAHELPARMEILPQKENPVSHHYVEQGGGCRGLRDAKEPGAVDAWLAIIVDDRDAVYPVRIDPTFSDANWVTMGSGMNDYVECLAVSGGTVYAGGVFSSAGGNAVNFIAQWNGSNWSALGSGMNGDVAALAVSGGTLYAGGDFTMAGGNPANLVAQWNGSSWSPLGLGMNSTVDALAVLGTNLYAGGSFTTAGGNPATNIARWNGSSWSAVGSGVSGSVSALAVLGGTLYAAGNFTRAGGIAVTNIAQWNGNSWSAVGAGIGKAFFYPLALAVSGSTLYAGGNFTTAGNGAANYIAQWNGSTWSPLGSGLTGSINGNGPQVATLAASGGTLYVGGSFTAAGGSPANCIAQWDGTHWSALGSGVSGLGADGFGPGVYALAASGTAVYAGGDFTTAGTNGCGYVAEGLLPVAAPPPLLIITANAAFGFTNGAFGFDVSGPSGSNVVIQSTTNLSSPIWVPLQTNLLGGGLLYFLDSQAPTNSSRFYRAVMVP